MVQNAELLEFMFQAIARDYYEAKARLKRHGISEFSTVPSYDGHGDAYSQRTLLEMVDEALAKLEQLEDESQRRANMSLVRKARDKQFERNGP